jgi:IMP dehydrogenase/GMP reductase
MGFRDKFKEAEKAFTFNDVILLPGWTTLEPNEDHSEPAHEEVP